MNKKKKITLIGLITTITALGASLLIFNNKDYKAAEATIDMSAYTQVTSENLESTLKVGNEVYFVTANGDFGVGIGEKIYKATEKANLTSFIVSNIDYENNQIMLFCRETGKYINKIRNNYSVFSSSDSTYVDIDENGHLFYDDPSYGREYYCWSFTKALCFFDNVISYINLYVLPLSEMSTQNQLGYKLINNLTCDSDGITPPSKASWDAIKESNYDLLLSDDDKLELTTLGADKDSPLTINKALAKYDYILSKYGTENYSNYLGRTVIRLETTTTSDVLTYTGNNNDKTIFVVTISLLMSSLSLLGYFIIRKKR